MITPSFSLTATERVLPKLALDFTTASLDSRVTFTRALATATRVNASGLIETVAADTPRFDYTLATGGACNGLLIEESRTNLAFNSSNVLTTNWNQNLYNGGASNFWTVTNGATNVIGPGNTNYFVATATPNGLYARQLSMVLAIATTYTASAYIYVPSQAGVTSYRIDIDFGGDYVVGAAQTTFDKWIRVSGTATLTAARTQTSFNFFLGAGSPPITGVAFYSTNFQVEQGAFATSYIPTTTLPVLRNADVATMTGTNFSSWFNQSAGSFVAQAVVPQVGVAGRLFAFDAGTIADQITVGVTASNTIAMGSTVANVFIGNIISANTISANTTFNVSTAYSAATTEAISLNATATTTTSLNYSSSMAALRLGQQLGSTYLNGTLKKLAYYPQRLIDNELQAFSK